MFQEYYSVIVASSSTRRPVKTEPNYARVLDCSARSSRTPRPRTRLTLSKHISVMFQNKLPPTDINRIIDLLFANKMISETNNRLTYEF